MDIEDIRLKKRWAEQRINEILQELEEETGTRVNEITHRHEHTFCNGGRGPLYVEVSIQLRV